MSNLEFKNGGIVIDGKTYAGGKLYIGNTEKEIDVGRVIVDVSNNNFSHIAKHSFVPYISPLKPLDIDAGNKPEPRKRLDPNIF